MTENNKGNYDPALDFIKATPKTAKSAVMGAYNGLNAITPTRGEGPKLGKQIALAALLGATGWGLKYSLEDNVNSDTNPRYYAPVIQEQEAPTEKSKLPYVIIGTVIGSALLGASLISKKYSV